MMAMFCGYRLTIDPEIPEVLRIGPGFMVVSPEELYGAAMMDPEVTGKLIERIEQYELSRVKH